MSRPCIRRYVASRQTTALALVAAVAAGCSGVISDPEASGLDDGSEIAGASCDAEAAIEPSTLLRLTRAQYTNSVLDTLGLSALPDNVTTILDLVADDVAGSFTINDRPPTEALAEDYVELGLVLGELTRARQAANTVDFDEANVCPAQNIASSRDCVRSVVRGLAARLYRRPIESSDVDSLLAVYDAILTAGGDAKAAFVTALAAVWSSPNFLYRAEATTADGHIDALALASRLSFLVWNSLPDAALVDRAVAGDLVANLESEIGRMLEDPRAARGRRRFFEQLLHLGGFERLELGEDYWTPARRQALYDETFDFIDYVYGEGDGTLTTLLAADFTVGDAEVAAHYGVDPPSTGAKGLIALPPHRRGLLTHASLLAQRGSHFPEVHRAVFVREAFLCDAVPTPTFDVPDEGPEFRLTQASCSGCHAYMDPLGFAFIDFDSGGRFQPISAERRASLPASPTLNLLSIDVPFAGPIASLPDFLGALAESPAVAACVTKHWVTYALNVVEHDEASASCTMKDFATQFATEGADLRTLLPTIVASELFLKR